MIIRYKEIKCSGCGFERIYIKMLNSKNVKNKINSFFTYPLIN